jgi:hypothetical protein
MADSHCARATRPCMACKASKTKCDRGTPCARCSRLGLVCVPNSDPSIQGQQPTSTMRRVSRKRASSTLLVSARYEMCTDAGAMRAQETEVHAGKTALVTAAMLSATHMRSTCMMANSWKLVQLMDLPFEHFTSPSLMKPSVVCRSQIELSTVPAALTAWLQGYSKFNIVRYLRAGADDAPFNIAFHFSAEFVNEFGYTFKDQLAAYEGVGCVGCPDCWIAEKLFSGTNSLRSSTRRLILALCSAGSYGSLGSSPDEMVDAVRSDGSRVSTWSAQGALPVSADEYWFLERFHDANRFDASCASLTELTEEELDAMLDCFLDG